MSYLVLARKWRPKTFEDVIGQEFITLTLKNAISSGKLAHALIFSGPRGVGKTTSARIVAKALNCENGESESLICVDDLCTFCSEITDGSSIDVQEIDAASHTGVNDVREIIENVKYLPSSAKTKVYIIDEAHMLSQAAFNALLKTLEEPPGHVLFILATTESHKIPATIQSRCQRYDFKKLSVIEIKNQLEEISKAEKIEVDMETLIAVSKEADGSFRDALSILDQLIATFGNNINYSDTLDVLGLLDKTQLNDLVKNIINKDPKTSIGILNQINSRGITQKKIADDLVHLIRNSLLIKISDTDLDLDLTDDEVKDIKEIVSGKTVEDLELLFSLAIENAENVHKSSFPELALESMVIKLATTDSTVPINEILNKLDTLSKNLGSNNVGSVKTEVSPPSPPPLLKDENSLPDSTDLTAEITTKDKEKTEESANFDTFSGFAKSKNTILGLHLEKAESVIDDEQLLKISFNESNINYEYLRKKHSMETIKQLADEFYNKEMKIRIELANNSISEGNNTVENINIDDPVVNDALNIFDGKILKNKGTRG